MEVQYFNNDDELEQDTHACVVSEGRARVTYPNGDMFEGDYKKFEVDHKETFLKDGTDCKYTFASTDERNVPCTYEGSYRSGQRTGIGSMTYADGSSYRGEWQQGVYHGKGSFVYSNSDIYSGTWNDNKRNGHGTYIFHDSECIFDGEWIDDEIVNGTFTHPDGTVYRGDLEQNAFNGKVSIKFSNGLETNGEFYKMLASEGGSEIRTQYVPEELISKRGIHQHIKHMEKSGQWP